MKRILICMAGLMLALAGCSGPSMQRYEPAPAPEVAAAKPVVDAKVGEEGVIFLVMPKTWKESSLHSCAPLTLVGEPRITTQSFGPVSKVEVAQVFRNGTAQTVDADWHLPVPPMAVILDLQATIGTRHFRAVVVGAEQAAALYAAAIQQGKHAALAQADEEGGFRLRLGQVRAGERVETAVVYAERTAAKQTHPSADAIPLLAALEAHEKILSLLALDRASGRPDHAKEAYDLAREAKIVSPVSSLLLVDAKRGK